MDKPIFVKWFSMSRTDKPCFKTVKLVKAINNGKSLAGLYGILSDISSLAFSFDSITFNWISRERNTVADCLAKQVKDVELAIIASPNGLT